MENTIKFKRFGTMIDCSRNAVMTVDALKKWIDLIAKMGYNALYLYTEDTYEVNDNPYFGHFRGRFSKEEIKEIVAYAEKYNMDVIPCIQTLAHLMNFKRWQKVPYDIDDIMLAGDDKVYELCDKIFETISETYKCKTVNVGMDEAQNLGRGIYADLHGNRDRSTILLEHLNKVCEIAKKYGLRLGMWSDMFFQSFVGGQYDVNKEFDDSIKNSIPDNVDLIYWDYWTDSVEKYDATIKAHNKLKPGCWFAGGLNTWHGFAPHNEYSIDLTKKAISACIDNGVEEVFLTMWGDDGGECSRFAALPSVFYGSQIAKGIKDEETIKKNFYDMFGITFDDFNTLDMIDALKNEGGAANTEKYLLYNDPFLGVFDTTLNGDENDLFLSAYNKLKNAKITPEWQYLFDSAAALAKVLSRKALLGVQTRNAYDNGDKEALKSLSKVYAELSKEVKEFYHLFRKQWFNENKSNGFEVQDARLGGLSLRLEHLGEVLSDYCDGKLESIAELEEKHLDYFGGDDNFEKRKISIRKWSEIISVNTVSSIY